MREVQPLSSHKLSRRRLLRLAALSTAAATLNAACATEPQPRVIRGEGRNASEWIIVTDHQRDEHVLKPILDLGLGNTLSSQNPISIERSVQNSGTSERWSVKTDSPFLAQGLEVTAKFPTPITDDKPERLLKPLPEEGMRQLPSEVTITSKLDLNALPEGLRPEDGKNLTYDQMQLILKLGLFKSSSESKVSSVTERDGSIVVRDLSTFNYVEPDSLTSPIVPAIGGVALFATGAYLWRAAKERFARPMTKKIVPKVEEDEFGYPIAPVAPTSDYEDEQIQQSKTAMQRALASQRSNRRRLLGAIALGAVAGATYNAWDHWEKGYASTTLSSDGAIEHKMYYSDKKPADLAPKPAPVIPTPASVAPESGRALAATPQTAETAKTPTWERCPEMPKEELDFFTTEVKSLLKTEIYGLTCWQERKLPDLSRNPSNLSPEGYIAIKRYSFSRDLADYLIGYARDYAVTELYNESGDRHSLSIDYYSYEGSRDGSTVVRFREAHGHLPGEVAKHLDPAVIVPEDILWRTEVTSLNNGGRASIQAQTLKGFSESTGLRIEARGPYDYTLEKTYKKTK